MGKITRIAKQYYANGKLFRKGRYINDKKYGVWKFYTNQSNKKSRVIYWNNNPIYYKISNTNWE